MRAVALAPENTAWMADLKTVKDHLAEVPPP